MLCPQEDFYEAFGYGDDEVLMPDLHATVAEVPESQDDLTLPDHSLQLDAAVHPDLETGPALASTLEQGDIPETVQSGNLAISQLLVHSYKWTNERTATWMPATQFLVLMNAFLY
jgi:hypothetical protein